MSRRYTLFRPAHKDTRNLKYPCKHNRRQPDRPLKLGQHGRQLAYYWGGVTDRGPPLDQHGDDV